MIYAFSFLIGLAVGSFINVLVFRLSPEKPDKTSLTKAVSGRSFCDSCGQTLRWFELIPVLSFICQKGRCLRCRKKISWQYPIVEVLTGAVFVLIFWKVSQLLFLKVGLGVFGFAAFVSLWWLIAAVMIAISVFDFKYYLIPDFLLYFLIILGVVLNVVYFFAVKQSGAFGLGTNTGVYFSGNLVYLLGADNWLWRLAPGVIFALLVTGAAYLMHFKRRELVSKQSGGLKDLSLEESSRGMALGDVILAFALSLVFGWPDILAMMLFSFIIGTVVSLALIFLKKKTMKDIVPFAPFLALGFMTLLLFGDKIIQAYLNLFPVFLL